MTALVGVDAGASHTEAVVADASLAIRARHRGPPGALQPRDVAPAGSAITDTVRAAIACTELGPASALAVGAAGAGREQECRALERLLRAAFGADLKLTVTTDAAVALEDAYPDDAPGIILVAGTGSVAFARDAAGTLARTGGLGWQLGDDGSAYALGRATLRAVGRALDGRGPPTALTKHVLAGTHAETLDELIRWSGSADRKSVALLAMIACEAAAGDDEVARGLVKDAADALANHVAALLPRFPTDEPVAVSFAGSLLATDSPLRGETVRAIERLTPRPALTRRVVDPARGALRLAARLLG